MKKIALILLTLVLIVAGVGYLAISNANAIVAHYKPTIEAKLSEVLGSPVHVGEIETSIIPQAKLTVKEFVVGENSNESLSLKNVSLFVSLYPLLKKELIIHELSLSEPSIHILKTSEGIKIRGLSQKHSQPTPPAEKKGGVQNEKDPITLSLQRFSLQNGSVEFVDETAPRTITVTKLHGGANIHFNGDLLTVEPLQLEGLLMGEDSFGLEAPSMQFKISDVTLAAPKVAVALGNNKLNLNVTYHGKSSQTDFVVEGDKLEASEFVSLLKKMKFAPATAKAQGPLGLLAEGSLTPTALEAKRFTLHIFGGTIEAPATIRFSNESSFSANALLSSLHIDEAFQFIDPDKPSTLFGTVVKLSSKTGGVLGQRLTEGLNGSFSLSVKDGGIRGVNIAGKALKAVDNIPFLKGSLYTYVPSSFHAVLESPDTRFTDLNGQGEFRDKVLYLKGIDLKGDLYSITADGTVGFDSAMNVNATITFNKEFSQGLVNAAHDFKKLLNEDGMLIFPIKISGTPPAVAVIPDVTKLLKTGLGREVTEKAAEALDKALQKRGLGGVGKILGF